MKLYISALYDVRCDRIFSELKKMLSIKIPLVGITVFWLTRQCYMKRTRMVQLPATAAIEYVAACCATKKERERKLERKRKLER